MCCFVCSTNLRARIDRATDKGHEISIDSSVKTLSFDASLTVVTSYFTKLHPEMFPLNGKEEKEEVVVVEIINY